MDQSVVGAGALMGAIHAATGPDHLSALATLAVNRQQHTAGWLGVRWGVGHSLGLVIVTGAMLILRDACGLHLDQMTAKFENGVDWVVGVIMLLIGFWGYRAAWKMRREALSPVATCDLDSIDTHDHIHGCEFSSCAASLALAKQETHSSDNKSRSTDFVSVEAIGAVAPATERSRSTRLFLATGVGILHGMGGPGGVLAVLPTLAMPGALGASLYLAAFCLSTILTMGTLASCFGACTYRSRFVSPRLPSVLQCASATASVCIGALWLVCSATGTLEEMLAKVGME